MRRQSRSARNAREATGAQSDEAQFYIIQGSLDSTMGKKPRSPGQRWDETVAKEAGRDLSQARIDGYLEILETDGLVKRAQGHADTTDEFRTLFVRAIESLRSWYKPSPIDDPQGLIALEMARLVLKVTPEKIEQGRVSPQEVGGLSSVLAGLLRHYFKEKESKKLMALILEAHKP